MEKDLIDKEVAIDIDQQTSNLRITAPKKKSEMSFNRANARHGPAQKNKQEFTPHDWKEYSERNIALSNKGIKSALHLQTAIDGLLARNTSNLRTQKVNIESNVCSLFQQRRKIYFVLVLICDVINIF